MKLERISMMLSQDFSTFSCGPTWWHIWKLKRHLLVKFRTKLLLGGRIRDYLCNVCHLVVYFGTKENLVILGLWTAENDAAMDLMERILPAGLLHYLQVLLYCIIWLFTKISSVVEFQRWWILKTKIFGQKSIYSKEIIVFWEHGEHQFVRNWAWI